MDDHTAIYNSRITKVYLKYLEKKHPNLNAEEILQYAGISRYEVDDQAHWFSQEQVDRFHEILVTKTGKTDISREAGRYSVSSEALGAAKQYVMGLMTISSIYLLMEKLYSIMSRGASVNVKRISSNKVEITSIPKSGVREKKYQCENRIGTFESLPGFFTSKFATVEHPSCVHRGDPYCKYLITWDSDLSMTCKLIRNYFSVLALLFSFVLFLLYPIVEWIPIFLSITFLVLLISLISGVLEKRYLEKTIKNQGDSAEKLLNETNIRYNNSLLVQEIGQTTSSILDFHKLIEAVIKAMEKHLDFDRGLIMLANTRKDRLTYTFGYGYESDKELKLRQTEFHLDKPDSQGPFVLAYKEKRNFLISDIVKISESLSKKSREFAQGMGIRSLICVPIVYEKESLGILAVDNVSSKRGLTQSDVNLLVGVASQTAISLVNARSYQMLLESEKKYRELVENANSIIMRIKIDGEISFFNEFAQRFFGYSENEILGLNIAQTILPTGGSANRLLSRLRRSFKEDALRPVVTEEENCLRGGKLMWIAWTYKPIFDKEDVFVEILCIGNDVTELKKTGQEKDLLEQKLQQAQKMEAIGTLAGGIAHDFNNILSAILGYSELALYELPERSSVRTKLDAVLTAGNRAKDLVQQILAFSRQTDDEYKPVHLHLVVKEALRLLRASLPSTIEIIQNIDSQNDTVMANATQIHQVVMNLCTNAHHAMAENGGVLEVKLSAVMLDEKESGRYGDLQGGEYVELMVRDTGYGMHHDTIERIFEPYYTTKDKGVGTGLGLSVVHGIVKRHRGAIIVESELGTGSSFSVLFPKIEIHDISDIEDHKRLRKGSERVLFVDDELALVDLGKQMLSVLGYRPECRTSSIEALEAFKADPNSFDLVITDLTMPNMTGDRLASELLAIRPDIPIILCTGFNEKMTDQKVRSIGIRELLLKPLVMRNVSQSIERVLTAIS